MSEEKINVWAVTCAKCNKMVDRVERVTDNEKVNYVAVCHGELEEIPFNKKDLKAIDKQGWFVQSTVFKGERKTKEQWLIDFANWYLKYRGIDKNILGSHPV